jgi:hypothetical protein
MEDAVYGFGEIIRNQIGQCFGFMGFAVARTDQDALCPDSVSQPDINLPVADHPCLSRVEPVYCHRLIDQSGRGFTTIAPILGAVRANINPVELDIEQSQLVGEPLMHSSQLMDIKIAARDP